MIPLPLDVSFPQPENDIEQWKDAIEKTGGIPPSLNSTEAAVSRDVMRWFILHLLTNEKYEDARKMLTQIDFDAYAGTLGTAWLYLAEMGLFIEGREFNDALTAGEQALRSLSALQDEKESVDYAAIAAAVIYNLSFLHYKLGENSKAEKELVKAQKIFDKLAKKDKQRFGVAIVNAISASTAIFNSRLKQMNILAHYQVATDLYLDKANHGTTQAIVDLVNSLKDEGDLHLSIGNYRDAVKYYTKALRYQKKITSNMGDRELAISINLGKALLHITKRQPTAEQLLRSMIPLAERLDAKEQLNEIHSLLEHSGKSFDFMSFIKNIF